MNAGQDKAGEDKAIEDECRDRSGDGLEAFLLLTPLLAVATLMIYAIWLGVTR